MRRFSCQVNNVEWQHWCMFIFSWALLPRQLQERKRALARREAYGASFLNLELSILGFEGAYNKLVEVCMQSERVFAEQYEFGSYDREKKMYTNTSPPLFLKWPCNAEKMAGTNEFAFFFRCRSMRTGRGPESGRTKIEKFLPTGTGTKSTFPVIKNLLMPLFLMGCFPMNFQEVKRPLRTKSVKRPIKVGKRPINEGKRPIKAMVLVSISIGCLMGCFRATRPWWKTAPLKRPIERSMKL